MGRPRIAFATAADLIDELDADWPALAAGLDAIGIDAHVFAWPATPAADLVAVTYAWDYVERREEFLHWVDQLAAPVVNPAAALAWSSDKRYLRDLEADGVPVVATTWVDPGAAWDPPGGEFVVKPAVGSGGAGTARYSPGALGAARAHVEALHEGGASVMVQPFVPSAAEAGETALYFFDGAYSHTASKRVPLVIDAGAVDELWRQERVAPAIPSARQVEVATDALGHAHRHTGPTAYARVDLIGAEDGQPLVLEVELVEPSLFLTSSPGADGRLAAALARWLQSPAQHA